MTSDPLSPKSEQPKITLVVGPEPAHTTLTQQEALPLEYVDGLVPRRSLNQPADAFLLYSEKPVSPSTEPCSCGWRHHSDGCIGHEPSLPQPRLLPQYHHHRRPSTALRFHNPRYTLDNTHL